VDIWRRQKYCGYLAVYYIYFGHTFFCAHLVKYLTGNDVNSRRDFFFQ